MADQVNIDEAAARLHISTRTLRRWVAGADEVGRIDRPGYPPVQVAHEAGALWFTFSDTSDNVRPVDAAAPDNARTNGGQRDTDGSSASTAVELRERIAALEADKAWLQQRLERAEEERAELRRMLNLEQQTVAALGEGQRQQLPAPASEQTRRASETHENPPALVQQSAASAAAAAETVRQAAKAAGLGKKQRRNLLYRLAGILHWER